MAYEHEIDAMRLAIALSARGLGTTSPNPPVGCVVLDANGDVASTGYHQRKGEPHAEAHALAAAGLRAVGATAVVTLEPCNHVGRTPACRQALLDAKIARVVIALIDPTSRGEGGVAALRAAGVDVEVGTLAEEARLVLGPWLEALDRHRPHVTATYVIAEDGARPVEGAALVALRRSVDAVLYDDFRVEEGVPNSHGQGIMVLPARLPTAPPAGQLKDLYATGVRRLLVGEPELAQAFLAVGGVDRLVLYLPQTHGVPRTHGAGPSPGSGQFVPADFRVSNLSLDGEYIVVECSAR